MNSRNAWSRRRFVGGLAAALGYVGLRPESALSAQAQAAQGMAMARSPQARARARFSVEEYDRFAKLAANENPYGPFDSVMEAMTRAFKYANRYGYPDGDIVEEIARQHGVGPENVLLGAGSGEILDVVGTTYLQGGRKVVGVEPSYGSVYRHATTIKSDAIKLPLLSDYRQDIPAIIKTTKTHYREVGFVYLCNPNNPTGLVVTRDEVRALLDGIPEDVPVLIDEAYHHFVEDPGYATSIPYVLEGRRVIVTRTFSKIAALAGMRLGFGVAPKDMIEEMRPYAMNSINAVVKWGGVAALKDTAAQEHVRKVTVDLREKATADLRGLGFEVIPSQTNFFMVHIGRRVEPVIEEFQKRGVLVGRPFPPMLEHLRVSVGTAEEMGRFLVAFKEIFPGGPNPTAASKLG